MATDPTLSAIRELALALGYEQQRRDSAERELFPRAPQRAEGRDATQGGRRPRIRQRLSGKGLAVRVV
jgi:hypothetical protein